jgi:hypothetical protein
MARTPLRVASYRIGPAKNTNDNVRISTAGARTPETSHVFGLQTEEDMLILRDLVSGDWIVQDYEGEATLFTMPGEGALDEVCRAATIYTAAFRDGFNQGASFTQLSGMVG